MFVDAMFSKRVGGPLLPMDNANVSVLAALTGSSVGGLAPVLSNYVLQRSQTQRDLLNRQITQRETLYSDFIREASRLYANSVTHSLENLDDLVSLYALVSRIRLLASEPVLHAAEAFVKQIVQHYGEPNLTVEQMRAAAFSAKSEPLDLFSLACRRELRDILHRGELSATIRN
jgi:hypothetical protein